jgi:hypothetical protein
MHSRLNTFWELKSCIRADLLARFDPSRMNLVQLRLSALERFIRNLIRNHSRRLGAASEDFLVKEIVKEFFTERPLIKATVLPIFRSTHD